MHINGLTIGYSDGIKTADYAPPRTVTLTANTAPPEGTNMEQHVADVLAMLKRRTHLALHGVELSGGAAAPVPQSEAEPAKRTRRTKEQIAADEAASGAASPGPSGEGVTSAAEFPTEGTAGAQVAGAGQASSGSATGASSGSAVATPGQNASSTQSAAGLEDEWDTTPATEVTDAALVDAVTKKNGELQVAGMTVEAAPVLIRNLLATYNPDPAKAFGLREIPQDKRADFLSKLAAVAPPKA